MRKLWFRIKHIRTRYTLEILFIIVLVAILLTSLALRQFQKGMAGVSSSVEQLTGEALYEQMEKKAEVVITTLSKNLINPFYYLDIETICALFKTVKAHEDVVYVYLYDADGKIVTDGTDRNLLLGEKLADEISKKAVGSKGFLLQREGDILDASMPIYMLDERLGGVRVGFYLGKIKSDILRQKKAIAFMTQRSARNTLVASALTGVILTILGIIFTLRITALLVRPILKLTVAARRVGRGDLAVKLNIRSGDELEELANSFNQMTGDLYNHRQELDSLHNSAKALTGNLEIESLLDSSLNTVRQILKISKGSIMLLEDSHLVIKRIFGWKPGEIPRGKPFSIGEGIAGYVAKRRESVLANDVNNHPLFEREDRRIWRGCRDLLCVPILHEDELRGIINIQDRLDGKPFTKTDLEYGEIIASSVALSLINIELIAEEIEKTRMEQELKTAETVQKTLFPSQDPKIEGIELTSFYEPATETGGDWFGYIEDKQMHRLVILIGDVSGHGIPSALVTAAVNSFIKTLDIMKTRFYKMGELVQHVKSSNIQPPPEYLALIKGTFEDPLRPANILKLLNKIVLDIGKRQLVMTFFVSVLDLDTKILNFANAGHPPPYFYRKKLSRKDIASGRRHNLSILKAAGVRLGEEEVADFKEEEVKLKKEDIIFWFTDGIVECENEQGEEFGDKRFIEVLQSSAEFGAPEIKNRVVSSAYKFFGKNPRKDDVALIVGKIR